MADMWGTSQPTTARISAHVCSEQLRPICKGVDWDPTKLACTTAAAGYHLIGTGSTAIVVRGSPTNDLVIAVPVRYPRRVLIPLGSIAMSFSVPQVPDTCIFSSSPPVGYSLPICESMVVGSVSCSVPPTCTAGWTGSATVTCGAHGAELTFSGCRPNVCTAPATAVAGYASLPVCEGFTSGVISCSQPGSCAAGYTFHATPTQAELLGQIADMDTSTIFQGAAGFYVLPYEDETYEHLGRLGCPGVLH